MVRGGHQSQICKELEQELSIQHGQRPWTSQYKLCQPADGF